MKNILLISICLFIFFPLFSDEMEDSEVGAKSVTEHTQELSDESGVEEISESEQKEEETETSEDEIAEDEEAEKESENEITEQDSAEKTSEIENPEEEKVAVEEKVEKPKISEDEDEVKTVADVKKEKTSKSAAEENSERIDFLESVLNEVERATLVDRLSLSADFRVTMNNYLYFENSDEKDIDKGLLRKDGHTIGAWNVRGRIKMHSMLGDKFKLTSWLTMYKQFLESAPGRYERDHIAPTYDSSRGYYPSDSRVYMERLYVDWFITNWFIFTIGRGSVVDGPPSDIRHDNVRLGTFQESAFNIPIEGMYLTLNLEELLSWRDSYFRFFYVPRVFMGVPGIDNNLFVTRDKPLLSIFGIHSEFGLPFYSGSKVYFQSAYSPAMRQGAVKQEIDGEEIVLHNTSNFGKMLFSNITFVTPRVFNSPVDLFFSVNHNLAVCPERNEENPGAGFFGLPEDGDRGLVPLASLLGNNLTGVTLHGFMFYGGLRYHTPIKMFNSHLKIGGDFNYGTKNHFSFYVPDTTGLSRFGIRGMHGETYVIIPLHRKANIRAAYIYERRLFEYDLYHSVGENSSNIPKTDEIIHNWNIMLNVHF